EARGWVETGGIGLDDEDNPLVKDGLELNYEKGTDEAINVYIRTDGKRTAIVGDEQRMDTGGQMHTGDDFVPTVLREVLKTLEYVEEQHPRDDQGQWTSSGGGGPEASSAAKALKAQNEAKYKELRT